MSGAVVPHLGVSFKCRLSLWMVGVAVVIYLLIPVME